jgi:hypothetical protein
LWRTGAFCFTIPVLLSGPILVPVFAKIISQMNQDNQPQKGDNTVKDPANWTTGGEPITGAQQSYLNTLASEAGEEVETDLTKAEASEKIEELQQKTGRGLQK